MKYDYLVVGAGLFGAVFAREAKKAGKQVLVLEKRQHIGGNVYTKEVEGIQVHEYGAHIFHTSSKEIWDYVHQFSEFYPYINSPLANYKGRLFNLPFNMNTFYQMWGVKTPMEARKKIREQVEKEGIIEPKNLEEQALSLVGRDIYETLIQGYTAKQWGCDPKELPAFIIQRLPLRFVYDNNYFRDTYQGIPKKGYTKLVEGILEGIEVRLGVDFFEQREQWEGISEKIVFTGPVDAFFDFSLGKLSYRSLKFETEVLEMENYQGNSVVNYTEYEVPYTRIIEHKHFALACHREDGVGGKTVITREYPLSFEEGKEPFYPINDEKNQRLAQRYKELAKAKSNVIFGGRLGTYRYYDMHQVIGEALACANKELKR